MPQRIVVISPGQEEWLKSNVKSTDMVLYTHGDVIKKSESLDRPAFILDKSLQQRLDIKVTPTIVSQEGTHLVINEYEWNPDTKRSTAMLRSLSADMLSATSDLLSTALGAIIPAAHAECKSTFINPVTDIGWSCIFPMRIAGVQIVGGEETPGKVNSPVCVCTGGTIPKIGLRTSFWEPKRIIDTVSDPYCMMPLGTTLNSPKPGTLSGGLDENGSSKRAFQQTHYYIFPAWKILDMFYDIPCLDDEGFDVAMMTEILPQWNNDILSLIINPEALLFANPILASQQDTVASDSAKVATTAVAAPAATDSVAKDTTAAAGTAAVASASSSTEASAAAPAVEEVKQIDPQVYKNFTYYVLLFLVICTVVAVIGKVLSIYELTRKMNGKYNPFANNTFQSALLFIFLVVFLYGVYWSYVHWGAAYWRSAVTEHGERIDTMFIITTAITTFVLVITHILLMTFTFLYRMRAKRQAYYYPHNNAIEKLWTIVPAVVLTVLVLFGFFTWRSITNIPEDLQKSALQIEVLGEQFQWNVRYAGSDGIIGKRNYKMTTPTNPYGIDFNDKNSWDDIQGSEIWLPVNKPVRFHIVSKDIIHSFFIPDFRVQINAVPGMTNYFQFTPTVTTEEMRDRLGDYNYDFVMLCNKICGQGHFNMAKKVVVVTEEKYKEWLAKQNKYFTEDLQKEFSGKTANVKKDSVQVTASLN